MYIWFEFWSILLPKIKIIKFWEKLKSTRSRCCFFGSSFWESTKS